ncbi:MAG: hypothetical protein IJZ77_00120 [Bacilli bacterium]|nr:hypothetical protein [Bacilli bacterium]
MKINNIKHSIWSLIFSIICCVPGIVGLCFCIITKETWTTLIYLLFAAAGLFLLVSSIINVQWANINNDKIIVRNIFGTIKEIEYVNINKAFKTNATIFSLKMLGAHKKYLVLSNYKSLQKSQIADAYSRRKYKYIIIPFSANVETMIKAKYKLTTGADLEIK